MSFFPTRSLFFEDLSREKASLRSLRSLGSRGGLYTAGALAVAARLWLALSSRTKLKPTRLSRPT
jgi:hypothetical protein